LFKDQFNPYEKAVYGSLAGYVSPVLPVCKTYMDFIWAYFKALYNKIIEKEIRFVGLLQHLSKYRDTILFTVNLNENFLKNGKFNPGSVRYDHF
jgi:hypothetical protein